MSLGSPPARCRSLRSDHLRWLFSWSWLFKKVYPPKSYPDTRSISSHHRTICACLLSGEVMRTASRTQFVRFPGVVAKFRSVSPCMCCLERGARRQVLPILSRFQLFNDTPGGGTDTDTGSRSRVPLHRRSSLAVFYYGDFPCYLGNLLDLPHDTYLTSLPVF